MKWKWGWVDQLRPKEVDAKLMFGDLVHQSLAAYYKRGRKRGPHPAKTFEQLYEKVSSEKVYSTDDERWLDMGDLGVRMLEGYVEYWKAEDSEYRIISSEQVMLIPIGSLKGRPLIYAATIDGVWQHLPSNKIRFVEHKTTTAIKEDALPMDEQVGAYWTFGPEWLHSRGLLQPGEKLDGILYNWLRKAAQDPNESFDKLGRRLNKDGTISKRQPAPYFHRRPVFRGEAEANMVRRRVRRQIIDMQLARKQPALHVYKNPGPQFMPNCKFCSFRDACELHETGNDYKNFIKAAFIKEDPYAPYNLAERV
jgi:hypothetical protein